MIPTHTFQASREWASARVLIRSCGADVHERPKAWERMTYGAIEKCTESPQTDHSLACPRQPALGPFPYTQGLCYCRLVMVGAAKSFPESPIGQPRLLTAKAHV